MAPHMNINYGAVSHTQGQQPGTHLAPRVAHSHGEPTSGLGCRETNHAALPKSATPLPMSKLNRPNQYCENLSERLKKNAEYSTLKDWVGGIKNPMVLQMNVL